MLLSGCVVGMGESGVVVGCIPADASAWAGEEEADGVGMDLAGFDAEADGAGHSLARYEVAHGRLADGDEQLLFA